MPSPIVVYLIITRRSPITTLHFDDLSLLPLLYGEHNSHLHHLEKNLGVQIVDRGNTLVLSGSPQDIETAERVLRKMWERIQRNFDISLSDIDATIGFAKQDSKAMQGHSSHHADAKSNAVDKHAITTKRKSLVPRTENQTKYVEALRHNDMVFGIGPAGTGKTYLAVAIGVEMYEKHLVERLVFCRPAVEAGEKLGFLPGDMKEKIDPYLRPIYDALYDFLGTERVEKMLERNEIEIAPLAFMRGRTLSHAYVVLDEAQNTTTAQMKMFLSRMGDGSHMVITGDPSQTDLPTGQKSGLRESLDILGNIDEIAWVEFKNADVVRHKLVGKILQAYDDAKR